MKTIRLGTFETNSSSCHTITLKCTPKELQEFNEGKRYYFYHFDYDNYKRIESFVTLEEIYPEVAKVVLSPEFENFTTDDFSYESASKYGINIQDLPWENAFGEEYIEKDFQKFKKYIIDNISFDMFRFAMEDDYDDPRYFSKVILRSFFQKFFMSNGCPLMKITDLDNTYSSSCSSDIRWIPNEYSNATHKIEISEWAKDKELIEVNIDIRDN